MLKDSARERQAILNSVSKHPNTRFSKLFQEVDSSPSQKNIVLLLIELTQQKEFYVDFNISLQYFLNLYEKLDAANKEFLFNEAGLLIYNAVQVYSRRVDCVQERMEDQLAELSSGQETKEKNNTDNPTSEIVAEKPKRRKRMVEVSDPYEIEIVSRKFRKLTSAKRFAPGTKIDTSKLYSQNLHAETYTHPSLWQHAEIIDLDNDEELDSKRNYRLFTYHLEHRYNTLVPDINFRLYFKMKDFMDEEDERDGESEFCPPSDWPPLSQAYVKRYLDLEDQMLAKHKISVKKHNNHREEVRINGEELAKLAHASDSGIGSSFLESSLDELKDSPNESETIKEKINSSQESQGDSGMDSSFLQLSSSDGEQQSPELCTSIQSANADTSTSEDAKEEEIGESKDELTVSIDGGEQKEPTTAQMSEEDKKETVAEEASNPEEKIEEKTPSVKVDAHEAQGIAIPESDSNEENTKKATDSEGPQQCDGGGDENAEKTLEINVRIECDKSEDCVSTGSYARLSQSNDEGVCLSDIDDTSSIPFTIHMSTTTTFQLQDKNGKEMYTLPAEKEPVEWPVILNIFEFPQNVLKKMRKKRLLTNLGEDMEIFLKARCLKRSRNPADEQASNPRRMKMELFSNDSSSDESFIDRCSSPESDLDFIGFTEDLEMVTRPRVGFKRDDIFKSPTSYKSLRLSRDSGVENDLLIASPEKNTIFFPPIEEEPVESQDETKELSDQSESGNIEILSNVLLPPFNSSPSSPVLESCDDTHSPENRLNTEETSVEEIPIPETGEPQPIDNKKNMLNMKFLSVCEEEEELSNHKKQNFDLSGDTAAKIQRWHKHLQPILANSRERHHFDVFQIGTDIIDEIEGQQSNSNSITFQHVMEHQDPSYVSRYFLSTLLLANQGNVELRVNNKSDNKPSEWHDLHLKLISKTRHVVSMEDNIGLPPMKAIVSAAATPKVKVVQTSRAKKRPPVSTLNFNVNLDLESIGTIEPIAKILRTSVDYDSGIFSNEDMENL